MRWSGSSRESSLAEMFASWSISSGSRASITSRRTSVTCPGAEATTLSQPGSVRVTSVARRSLVQGARVMNSRLSSFVSTRESRGSEALVRAASSLVSNFRPEVSDSTDKQKYSKWVSPVSLLSWVSSAEGSNSSTAAKRTHASCSRCESQRVSSITSV